MLKRPFLSLLQIFGLGLGVGACFLLVQYINWQWGFDRFHDGEKRIVRIQNDRYEGQVLTSSSAMTYSGVPVIAKELFPEVTEYVRLARWIANDVVFRNDENLFRGKDCFFTEPSFFEVFSFELVQGNPVTALLEPNSLVLTESTAKTLFGDSDPLYREVIFENLRPFKVTGVVKDPPAQSHIQFDLLASLTTMTDWGLDVYGDDQLNAAYSYAYLQVHESSDLNKLEQALSEEIKSRKSDPSGYDEFALQELEKIHLYSKLDNEIATTGDGNNIWILGCIAVLILILGWINHFNIFSATAIDQASSLGVRKLLGARRKQIFAQLFVAASITSILGLGVGLILARLTEPLISNAFQIPFNQISFNYAQIDGPGFMILVLLLGGSLFIGLIPAFALSLVNPLSLQTIEHSTQHKGLNFRRILVASQLIIIVVLIACTGIVYRQTLFMQKKDKGFTLENVMVIKGPLGFRFDQLRSSFPAFKQELESNASIDVMGVSKSIPGDQLELIGQVSAGNHNYSYSFYRNYGSLSYFEVYEIPFVVMDETIDDLVGDERFLVLNEMAAKWLGYTDPEEALGRKISFWETEGVIKGVVANYHQRSLHHSVVPIIYDFGGDNLITDGYYSIKTNNLADPRALMVVLEDTYNRFFPQTVFEPLNVGAWYESQYIQDRRFMYLNIGFTFLSLVIACMGLLGLMMTTLDKRSKEICIRKILGASVTSILVLLTKDTVRILAIAVLIGSPTVYILMTRWLQNFNFRIEFPWWMILFSGLLACVIVLLTVGFQTIKAARNNPVEVLRQY